MIFLACFFPNKLRFQISHYRCFWYSQSLILQGGACVLVKSHWLEEGLLQLEDVDHEPCSLLPLSWPEGQSQSLSVMWLWLRRRLSMGDVMLAWYSAELLVSSRNWKRGYPVHFATLKLRLVTEPESLRLVTEPESLRLVTEPESWRCPELSQSPASREIWGNQSAISITGCCTTSSAGLASQVLISNFLSKNFCSPVKTQKWHSLHLLLQKLNHLSKSELLLMDYLFSSHDILKIS